MNLEPFARTFKLNGLQLTSAIDRQAEARQLVSRIPEDAAEVWVYGPALGDAVLELLKRPGVHVHVVRMIEELPVADFGPRVTVHRAADAEFHTPYVVSPVELRLCDKEAWHLRDRINAHLNDPFNHFLFDTMNKHVWDKQRNANMAAVASDAPVRDLFATDTRDAIVFGGGPTAALYLDWVRESGMNVIAASTALIPLVRAGIQPDVVICIDRDPKMVKHFAERCTGALVYDPAVEPSIVAGWPGKRYVVREGDLYCGGSVIHHQMDLAVRMGAQNVYFVGADFCYPGGQSHLPGVALPFDASDLGTVECVNGHGATVRTDINLAQYRVFVEEYVKTNAHIGWWKLGRDGAETKGVRWFDGV